MVHYQIEFWRGDKRVLDYESNEFCSPEDAQYHIDYLLREMIADPWEEDWTGCRFEVVRGGLTVLEVPVLAAMSALARRMAH